jgi:predicted nucleotidyltransferase
MLKILNDLGPFIDDNYRRINVREYSRLQKISPPTASKLLENFSKEGLLKKYPEKNYIYYYANKDNEIFIDLSRAYWRLKIKDTGLLDFLEKCLLMPTVILFGSLSKGETNTNSDVDIAIFTHTKKEINIEPFEKKIGRKIQLFIFKDKTEVKNLQLLNNILNGYKLIGEF